MSEPRLTFVRVVTPDARLVTVCDTAGRSSRFLAGSLAADWPTVEWPRGYAMPPEA